MTARDHWERLSETGWRNMAVDYLAANREEPSVDEAQGELSKIDMIVTGMRFEAAFDKLWRFILLTLSLAETDWQIELLGAGELEHLLGWQQKWDGVDYIALVEKEAQSNGKLNRALLITQKYKMTDEVWTRVQRLKEQIKSQQLPLAGLH